jgi:hypothetical protein
MPTIIEPFVAKIIKKETDGIYVLTKDEDDVYFIPSISGNITNESEINLSNTDDYQRFYVQYYISEEGAHGGKTARARQAMTGESERRKAEKAGSERRKRMEIYEKFDDAYNCAYSEYIDQIKALKEGIGTCGETGTPTYPIPSGSTFGKDLKDWIHSRNAKKENKLEGAPKATIVNTRPKRFALRYTEDKDLQTPCADPKANAAHEFFGCLEQQGVEVPKEDRFVDVTRQIDARESSAADISKVKRTVQDACQIVLTDDEANDVVIEAYNRILRPAGARLAGKTMPRLDKVSDETICSIARQVKAGKTKDCNCP